MAGDASTRLASHALGLSGAIFALYKKHPKSFHSGYRIAYDIAVRLHLINEYLRSLPPYWIGSDVEQLSHAILWDLQAIVRPKRTSPYFRSLFNHTGLTDQETCLLDFFTLQEEHAQRIKVACDNLIKLLEDTDDDEVLPASTFQLDVSDASNALNHFVLDELQMIAECDPTLHESYAVPTSEENQQALRHPARLCLHEIGDGQDLASRNIVVLVSDMDSAIWQEFCLRIHPGGPVEDNQQPLCEGDFCKILEREINARIILSFKHGHGLFLLSDSEVLSQEFQAGRGEPLKSVLEQYDLTPKDKVMLSYAIARSYWKYYDSGLMNAKWTSDTIWFMSGEGEEHEDQLPLCAYVPLPTDPSGDTTPDILDQGLLTHRCPRIFDLGLLLLQIGLAKPFRTGKRRYEVSQANLNHRIALNSLLELEKTDWAGFTNSKKYYDNAIKFCLDSRNFTAQPKQRKSTRQGDGTPSGLASTSDWQAGISRRRKILFRNVVLPLAWLAKGFGTQAGDITYARKKPSPPLQRGISNIPQISDSEALFHSHIVPDKWLRDLKLISVEVERKRRRCRVGTPVRIAILDTGLNKDLDAFRSKIELLQNIVGEKDFVKPGTPIMTDTFGHGTFMARLIMECAPNIEILVARVAENTRQLERSGENIKEAILWAGQEGNADIISMSFGFPKDDRRIREAIETVRRNREDEIIFLASAGNSSTDDESFPARHPGVISVYATDCHGVFLSSNSAATSTAGDLLGTYGDDLPDFIHEEFSTAYPGICQPGSSVATAIMAGISATMLAYGSVLPSLVRVGGVAASDDKFLKYLRTTNGMEKALRQLAQDRADHSRLKAVKPMWFWKQCASDLGRYCDIVHALKDFNRWSA
ncbi:hypothetical protein F4861DRAFT_545583 [Xylaria intraflava]|nr:hypothetical protein F4861DRAFT_545583 [Xylaria intraflava]